jgi:nitrate/nitrite transporter NarK
LTPLGIFTFCFGFTASTYQGLAFQSLMGLSAGVNFSATTKIVSAWFPPVQRGVAFGILAVASSLPVVIANAAFPFVIQSYSWGALYRGLGVFTVIIAAACFLTLRDAPRHSEAQPQRTAAQPGIATTIRLILGNRTLLMFTLAGFGGVWGTWGFAFWSNALLVKGHGLSLVTAGEIMTLFGVGAVIAKPLYGLLSDRLGGRRKALMIVAFACACALMLVFAVQDTVLAFKLVAPILGVAAFGWNPLQTALLTELIGKEMVGSLAGLNNAFWQLATVVVPVVVGFVFEMSNSFFAAVAVLAFGPLLAAVCMAFVKEPKTKA